MDFLKGFKTWIGVIVAFVVVVAPQLGVNISESDLAFISEGWDKGVETGALLFAGYGLIMKKMRES